MPLGPVAEGDPHVPAHNAERDAINALEVSVGDRIPFPPGAATGDLLRWDGTQWLTTETRFFEGEGRPDGNFAAPVGSRYIDKIAQQGAVEWVKRFGGDSADGWLCLAGQTGPRNVSAQIDRRTNGVIHAAHLVRSGQMVEFYIDITMPSDRTSPYTLYTLPIGFRPTASRYGALGDNKEGADTGGTLVNANGAVQILAPVNAKRDRYFGNWITDEPWPAALPGTAL
jgi:hypothetical protein